MCIDQLNDWSEAQALFEITVWSITETFVNKWITRFGASLYIMTREVNL